MTQPTQINDGGPAFPLKEEDGGGGYVQFRGMSLRDWFAGQALLAVATSPVLLGIAARHTDGDDTKPAIANLAYGLADAMLAERAKGGAQ